METTGSHCSWLGFSVWVLLVLHRKDKRLHGQNEYVPVHFLFQRLRGSHTAENGDLGFGLSHQTKLCWVPTVPPTRFVTLGKSLDVLKVICLFYKMEIRNSLSHRGFVRIKNVFPLAWHKVWHVRSTWYSLPLSTYQKVVEIRKEIEFWLAVSYFLGVICLS